MRTIAIIALFTFLFLAGCSDTYYYKPGNTLEQTEEDWDECYQQLMSYGSPEASDIELMDNLQDIATQCMLDKGYQLKDESKITQGTRTKEGIKEGIYYWLAGD